MAVDAVDDPLEDPHVLAEAGPEVPAIGSFAEPVHSEDPGRIGKLPADVEPVIEVVGHVVAAERQHGHGVAANRADIAGGGGRRFRTHRRGEKNPVAPAKSLVNQRDNR